MLLCCPQISLISKAEIPCSACLVNFNLSMIVKWEEQYIWMIHTIFQFTFSQVLVFTHSCLRAFATFTHIFPLLDFFNINKRTPFIHVRFVFCLSSFWIPFDNMWKIIRRLATTTMTMKTLCRSSRDSLFAFVELFRFFVYVSDTIFALNRAS